MGIYVLGATLGRVTEEAPWVPKVDVSAMAPQNHMTANEIWFSTL